MKSFSLLPFLCILLLPVLAFSGEFRVSPIRLELDRANRNGTVTVVNEAEEKLNVQMKAFEWSEDGDGKDQYTETNDIIFFPRIMTVEKKEERVLRAGIKIPATTKEKTYRLFIEEIPNAQKGEGVNVAITIRFGVPIFVKPIKEDVKGEIESVTLSNRTLNAAVRNKGNVHFIIHSIDIKGTNSRGEGIFTKELSGWYLLSGASRLYSASIPPEICKQLSKLDLEVKTNKANFIGKLDVNEAMCTP
jgi:fimbrial chaperone protein